MGKIIALANQKGGVGKTTLEKKVLVVDADPQANASSGLGVDIRNVEVSIYECLVNGNDAQTAVVPTEIEGLDIIPSHIDLVGAEIEMLNMDNREQSMRWQQPIRWLSRYNVNILRWKELANCWIQLRLSSQN